MKNIDDVKLSDNLISSIDVKCDFKYLKDISTNDKSEEEALRYKLMNLYLKIGKKFNGQSADEIWKKYKYMRLMAGCHSRRFPIVKKWFLELYPEVKNWGKALEEIAAGAAVSAERR